MSDVLYVVQVLTEPGRWENLLEIGDNPLGLTQQEARRRVGGRDTEFLRAAPVNRFVYDSRGQAWGEHDDTLELGEFRDEAID